MPELFDPYHRWLGIAAKDQPANHYRLLAIDLFESDREVIRDASEQRMAHVRSYQLGEHLECSQRILNELATAKACLLDPNKKAAYDASLRELLSAAVIVASPAPPQVAPPPVAAVVPPDAMPLMVATEVFPYTAGRLIVKSRARRSTPLLISGGTAAALLVGLLTAFLCYRPGATGPEKRSKSSSTPSIGGITSHERTAPTAKQRRLATVKDQTIRVGATLHIQFVTSDPQTTNGRLSFRLVPGTPAGAMIDAQNGKFTWTPTQAQAGRTYPITVQIHVDGAEKACDETTFAVAVQKAMQKGPVPLELKDMPPQEVCAGSKAIFCVGVMNGDAVQDKLTYRLLQMPEWVSIDSQCGVVTCSPGRTERAARYTATVRVTSESRDTVPAEKSFEIVVVKPIEGSSAKLPPSLDDVPSKPLSTILHSSGKPLALADLDLRDQAQRAAKNLCAEIMANRDKKSASFFATSQDKRTLNVEAVFGLRGMQPDGPAVSFHSCPLKAQEGQPRQFDKLKVFATYKSGKLEGPLATWDDRGRKEYWCNYAKGKREGLRCLFQEDKLAAVLECARDKPTHVHLIKEEGIVTSLANMEDAYKHDRAGPLLKEVDRIDRKLDEEDEDFRDCVTKTLRKEQAERSRQHDALRNERSRQQSQFMNELWQRSLQRLSGGR